MSGVGILISNSLGKHIDRIYLKSCRIIALTGKFRGMNMCVISAYAPPLYAEHELKDAFYDEYEELNEVRTAIPVAYKHHIVILGDFNARIGHYDPIW